MIFSDKDLEGWASRHSDAYHPGGRDTCPHCQEMIRLHGPMPPSEEIERYVERTRQPRSQNKKKFVPEYLRWEVWERDNFTCKDCGARRDLTVDHIYPESAGGPTEPSNLQTLCRRCNSKKGARIVE